jgi:membrane protein YqaA with SNARE-associated domain
MAQALAAERAAYVRRNVVGALLSLGALFGIVVLAGVVYESELLALTHWIYHQIGIPGLATLLFLADSVTAPIPPDVILVVVAKTDLAHSWYWLVPLGGALSAVAGVFGWTLGVHLSGHRAIAPLLAQFNHRHGDRVRRYGKLTVALGALTPLPFSITCWSAGALGMPLREFFPVTLLRIPRYVVFYLGIAYAADIATRFGD